MNYRIFQKYNDSLISKFNQKDKFQEAMNSKFFGKGTRGWALGPKNCISMSIYG